MTTYEEVFDVFLSQITDANFITVDEDDALKIRYLHNSIPKFYCSRSDLNNRNEDDKHFNVILSAFEKQILGQLMHVEYLSPQISNISNLQQALGNKDFSMTSQANHLKELKELRNDVMKEVRGLMRDYTYNQKK